MATLIFHTEEEVISPTARTGNDAMDAHTQGEIFNLDIMLPIPEQSP